MIQSGVLGVQNVGNSSKSKFWSSGAFRIGQHEERVNSFTLLNESPRTAVSPIRTSSHNNVLGSGR
jgi:hypothetical protein